VALPDWVAVAGLAGAVRAVADGVKNATTGAARTAHMTGSSRRRRPTLMLSVAWTGWSRSTGTIVRAHQHATGARRDAPGGFIESQDHAA
jgi:hypothetical protein